MDTKQEIINRMEEHLKALKIIADTPKMPNNAAEFDRWERFDRFVKAVKKQEGQYKNISFYDLQAKYFCIKNEVQIQSVLLRNAKYFNDDTETRNIYQVIIYRPGDSYSFTFGQSIVSTKEGKDPKPYDILSCLTKYDPENFENFCAEYGYDMDSRKAEKTYHDVQEEYNNVVRLFSDCMEELQEIN